MLTFRVDDMTCGHCASSITKAIRAVDNVLETLKRLGLSRFIRVKEEPNKEAMLAEPEAVAGLAGVKIEQGEDFVIVPFETELEEVA